MQKLLKGKGPKSKPERDNCMLVQIRMYLDGDQPAVVKMPKKSSGAPKMWEGIVEQNKIGHRKLT